MEVLGGVIGQFTPDKENKNISYPVLYTAAHINYNLKKAEKIYRTIKAVAPGLTGERTHIRE